MALSVTFCEVACRCGARRQLTWGASRARRRSEHGSRRSQTQLHSSASASSRDARARDPGRSYVTKESWQSRQARPADMGQGRRDDDERAFCEAVPLALAELRGAADPPNIRPATSVTALANGERTLGDGAELARCRLDLGAGRATRRSESRHRRVMGNDQTSAQTTGVAAAVFSACGRTGLSAHDEFRVSASCADFLLTVDPRVQPARVTHRLRDGSSARHSGHSISSRTRQSTTSTSSRGPRHPRCHRGTATCEA